MAKLVRRLQSVERPENACRASTALYLQGLCSCGACASDDNVRASETFGYDLKEQSFSIHYALGRLRMNLQ